MIYQKYGKGLAEEEKSADSDGSGSESEKSFNELTYNEELEHLLFFRTCVVKRDKEILKIRMKQTVALRDKMLKKEETKFPEMFPFYFIEPDLVSAKLFKNTLCG